MEERRRGPLGTYLGALAAGVGLVGLLIWVSAGPDREQATYRYWQGVAHVSIHGSVERELDLPLVVSAWTRLRNDETWFVNARWNGDASCPICELRLIGDYDDTTHVLIRESVEVRVHEEPYAFYARRGECTVTLGVLDSNEVRGTIECVGAPTIEIGDRRTIDLSGSFDLVRGSPAP